MCCSHIGSSRGKRVGPLATTLRRSDAEHKIQNVVFYDYSWTVAAYDSRFGCTRTAPAFFASVGSPAAGARKILSGPRRSGGKMPMGLHAALFSALPPRLRHETLRPWTAAERCGRGQRWLVLASLSDTSHIYFKYIQPQTVVVKLTLCTTGVSSRPASLLQLNHAFQITRKT